MKNQFYSAGFVLMLLASTQAFAKSETKSVIETVAFQPCPSWRYDFDSYMYGCTTLRPTVKVLEAASTQTIIDDLERRILALEQKVARLQELTSH